MSTDEKALCAEEAPYLPYISPTSPLYLPPHGTDEKVFWAEEARRSLARSALTCTG